MTQRLLLWERRKQEGIDSTGHSWWQLRACLGRAEEGTGGGPPRAAPSRASTPAVSGVYWLAEMHASAKELDESKIAMLVGGVSFQSTMSFQPIASVVSQKLSSILWLGGWNNLRLVINLSMSTIPQLRFETCRGHRWAPRWAWRPQVAIHPWWHRRNVERGGEVRSWASAGKSGQDASCRWRRPGVRQATQFREGFSLWSIKKKLFLPYSLLPWCLKQVHENPQCSLHCQNRWS